MASWTDTPGAGELGALGPDQWGSQLHFQSLGGSGGPGNSQPTSLTILLVTGAILGALAILVLSILKIRRKPQAGLELSSHSAVVQAHGGFALKCSIVTGAASDLL